MNDSLGTILNFFFRCEKRMTVWVQMQNFVFRGKKTNGRLCTTVKFRILLQKKRMVAWVHALFYIRYLHNNITMLSIPKVQNNASTS